MSARVLQSSVNSPKEESPYHGLFGYVELSSMGPIAFVFEDEGGFVEILPFSLFSVALVRESSLKTRTKT